MSGVSMDFRYIMHIAVITDVTHINNQIRVIKDIEKTRDIMDKYGKNIVYSKDFKDFRNIKDILDIKDIKRYL